MERAYFTPRRARVGRSSSPVRSSRLSTPPPPSLSPCSALGRPALMEPDQANSPSSLRRFIPLEEVAELFSISKSQAYALVRSGELRAIKVGGRGQWRIELTEIERFIDRAYTQAEAERETVDSQIEPI